MISKKQLFSLLILLIVITNNSNAQVTMFSANPLKKGQFVFFNQTQYFEKSSKYNWNTKEFTDLADTLKTDSYSLLPMVGYGLNERLSFFVQYPLYFDRQNDVTKFYQGDVMLMARYAIFSATSNKSGILLIGGLRLPTADYHNNPYADGSVDVFLGEIFSTKWYGDFKTHLKSEYYFNTKNKLNENPGDEFRFFFKQDYRFTKKFKVYMNNIYTYQSKKRNSLNELVDNTQQHRILHIIGGEYIFNDVFVVKPKVQAPSYGVGGSLFNTKFILDFVYYL